MGKKTSFDVAERFRQHAGDDLVRGCAFGAGQGAVEVGDDRQVLRAALYECAELGCCRLGIGYDAPSRGELLY